MNYDSKSVYVAVVTAAAPAFAAKNQDPTSVRQLSHALARDLIVDLARMGLLEDNGAGILGTAAPVAASPTPGAPQFSTPALAPPPPVAPAPAMPTISHPAHSATPRAYGVNGPEAPVAVGGGSLAQPAQPAIVNGQLVVPPPGASYTPPNQAGVMNVVQQVSTPQGHSALGTAGIISPVTQKPSGGEQIVAPQGEKVISGVGGATSTFVPEQIAR